ncbi:MAG: hypothetical protein E6936_02190 [Clostridium perfringens]|nr:hypothetical protein [Clostridium perfringens]MDU2320637.1 hypothetical protein [Clostridium perfringens]
MRFDGAVIEEQGVTFAIVVVKPSAVSTQYSIAETQNYFAQYFPNMPIILMCQDFNGTPTYYGERNIVNFLAGIYMEQIPWKTYTI